MSNLLIVLGLLMSASWFRAVLCCHDGNLYDYGPYSQTVSVGESVSFLCKGGGSHLYWFIDGINTVSMSSQEISDRGLSLNGSYNYNPPYQTNGLCNPQDSYLTITGNCLNNNTEIYCVILGTTDGLLDTTTSKSILTVTGAICKFTAVQTSIDSLLLQWELKSISSPYTQKILVKKGTTMIYSKELNKIDRKYQFKSEKAFHSCIQYNITLMIETADKTLSDSWSVTENLKGEPLKLQNVTALEQVWKQKYLIQFEVTDSLLCNNSIPSTIKLVILNNGDLITSDAIPWDNATALPSGLHQTELNVNLTNDAYYYLLVVSQSKYDEKFSEPSFIISTFDVIDAQYSFNNDTAEFCVTCIFANESQAIGCVTLLSTTTNIYSMKITKDTSSNNTGSGCVTVGDSGLYSISVYDWEGNDDDILRNEPAVKTVTYLYVTVNEVVSESYSDPLIGLHSQSGYSSLILQTSYTTHTISTTAGCLLSQTVIESQQQHVNGDTVSLIFGTLFGVSLLLLLVISVVLVLVIVGQKKSSNARSSSSNNDRSNDDTLVQKNSAYELMKEQQVNRNPLPHVAMKEDHEYITDVYDTFITDPVKNEQCYRLLPPPTASTNTHIYANVHR